MLKLLLTRLFTTRQSLRPWRTSRSKGFTLIELLVVVAIIGLLVSIISVSLTRSRIQARDTRRVSDMKQTKTGMDLYFTNAGGYPDTGAWVAGSQLSCNGTQIFQVPKDPSGTLYSYTYTASGNSITGCGTTVRSNYEIQFFIEARGFYYIMDEDGKLRESVTGAPTGFDSLL